MEIQTWRYDGIFGLSGYASDKAIDFDSDSPWLWHVDGPDKDRIFDIYSTYVNYGGDVVKKSDKKLITLNQVSLENIPWQ